MSELSDKHWENFLYARTPKHWHAIWLRYSPDGALTSKFHAERIFKPLTNGTDGTQMHVIYHYDDERGTVSEGPQSGPWNITKEAHSAADGLQHPSQTVMTTLMLPGGPSAWCKKLSTFGTDYNASEMFLHHGEQLRMSAGVVQNADGSLKQLSLIREADPAFDGWAESTEATTTTPDGLAACLDASGFGKSDRHWPSGSRYTGIGHAITADLQQRNLVIPFADTRIATADANKDVILQCPDNVAIIAPKQRKAGAPFSYAAAWWPSSESFVLYTIEAIWDGEGALQEVRHMAYK